MSLAETAVLAVQLKLEGASQFKSGIAEADAATTRLGASATSSSSIFSRAASGFKSGIVSLGSSVSQMGSHLKGVLTGPLGILGLTGGLIGVTQAIKGSVESAVSFQSAMELIRTQAGGTAQEVANMTEGILKMSTSVATAPEELAKALFHIESSGFRAAQALDVLKIAAEGARVGHADLESVTNALIATQTSGIKGTKSLAEGMGVLNAIIGQGNMRMGELAGAFTTGILSAGKAFGVSIQSVGAALADMTRQGQPAEQSATRLRMTLSLLAAPTSKAVTIFKSFGLGALDLANAMRGPGGLASAIQLLHDKMQKAGLIDANGNVTSQGAFDLSHAFGGGRSSAAILTLLQSVTQLKDIQAQITKQAGGFGDAWAATQQNVQFKFEKFQASLSQLAIRLGDVLLPVFSGIADSMSNFLSDNGPKIQRFFKGLVGTVENLGKVATGTIVPMIQAIHAAWDTIPKPLRDLLVGGVIADRTIHFLLGVSPIHFIVSGIEGALAKGLASLASGTILQKAFVQPVFVTNWAMMGGGGLGGVAADAAGSAGGIFAGLGGLSVAAVGQLALLAAVPLIPLVATYFLAGGSAGLAASDYAGRSATAVARGLAPGNVPVAGGFGSGRNTIADWYAQHSAALPVTIIGPDMEKLRGGIGDALAKAEARAKEIREAILADRKARGLHDVHGSADPAVRALLTMEHQLAFLTGHHTGAQDIAVAHDLAIGFEGRNTSPASIVKAINELKADQRTVGAADARTIGGYITRMQAALSAALKTQKTATDILSTAARHDAETSSSIASAIANQKPPNVSVSVIVGGAVVANSLIHRHTVVHRYGPSGGSRVISGGDKWSNQ